MDRKDQDLSDTAQINSIDMIQNSHTEQDPVNIQDRMWIIVACIVVGTIFCLLTILAGLCWLGSLLDDGENVEKIIADDGYDVEGVTETTASINKNDDEDRINLEQKRENVDTYTEENEFDEELYDSELQGFSNQDESDSFSYQLNDDIDYLEAYSSIVEEIWHSYDEYCEYTLFDLDQDGIKELITSQGTCDADWTNDVYMIEDGYISMIGQFYGAVMLYVAEDGNGLYAVYGHMGFQNIDQITKNGGQLQVDTIMNGDIGEDDYYSNDNPVNFVTVTDDSLLRQ